jgi:vacuolar-type H+-ATPase subunit I/STV1
MVGHFGRTRRSTTPLAIHRDDETFTDTTEYLPLEYYTQYSDELPGQVIDYNRRVSQQRLRENQLRDKVQGLSSTSNPFGDVSQVGDEENEELGERELEAENLQGLEPENIIQDVMDEDESNPVEQLRFEYSRMQQEATTLSVAGSTREQYLRKIAAYLKWVLKKSQQDLI